MDIKKSVKNAQKLLGIEKLRKPQVKPINRILEGGDTMVIAPVATSWGHSFREDYLKIGKFVDGLAERPVITALTATATPKERKEIGELLSMKNPECFVNSLYRPNLHYLKQVHVSDEAKLKALKKLLRKRAEGSCIIYCNTKRMTDAVYEQVSAWYPNQTAKCHSNLYGMTRKANETAFLNGEKTIMVATSAFGMGIDQSKVNLVIHFNMPLSLADYYQQSGRAGREGQKSKCVLLYCENDYYVNRVLLADIANAKARKGAFQALDRMKEYAESTGCLTQQLLNELGEQMDKPCGSCTNCQRRRKKQ